MGDEQLSIVPLWSRCFLDFVLLVMERSGFGLMMVNAPVTRGSILMIIMITERSLEVKLPTIWTNGKAEVGTVREGEKKREDQGRERVRRKKMQMHEMVGKSRFTVFLQ